ncbi:MAG: type III pantothenate kinase [Clostridiales bacterium]|jgi:type III pantothenate kinase|nr:type III pantothenate kinase [Clostridiales bacterium]
MILAIDIGNTNIKIGVFNKDILAFSFRLSSRPPRTSDEYGVDIVAQLDRNGVAPDKIKGIVIGSVNPNLNYSFERVCEYYFGKKALFVGSGIKTGMDIKYDNPKEVGADRIAGCVAAVYKYGAPLIVIDCGTATTFNVINAQKQFLGGAISMGLKTGADSLSNSAARLPEIELIAPTMVVGKNTIANMQSGIIYGFIGAVEYIVNSIKRELNTDFKVICTGGLSQLLKSHSSVFDVVDRSLTLYGLYRIFLLNA